MADADQDDDDVEICEDRQVASIPKQISNILNEYPADAKILKDNSGDIEKTQNVAALLDTSERTMDVDYQVTDEKSVPSTKHKNWYTSTLALKYLQPAFVPIVQDKISSVHDETVSQFGRQLCAEATAEDIVKSNKDMAKFKHKCDTEHNYTYACQTLLSIIKSHTSDSVDFFKMLQGTDPQKWTKTPLDFVRLFLKNWMRCGIEDFKDCDISALCDIIKRFKPLMQMFDYEKIAAVKRVRNKTMHCAQMDLSQQDMEEHIEIILDFLNHIKSLKNTDDVTKAIYCIEQLKTGDVNFVHELMVELITGCLPGAKQEHSHKLAMANKLHQGILYMEKERDRLSSGAEFCESIHTVSESEAVFEAKLLDDDSKLKAEIRKLKDENRELKIQCMAARRNREDRPGTPKLNRVLFDSVDIEWDGVHTFCDGDAYQVHIKNIKTRTFYSTYFKVNKGNIGGLQPGTPYVFKVRLVKDNGDESDYSENSDEVTTRKEPQQEANIPGKPYAERVFSDSVDIVWDGVRNFGEGDAYQVRIENTQTGQWNSRFFERNRGKFTDLQPGATYVLKVRLVRANGEESKYSENSEELKIKKDRPGKPITKRVLVDGVDIEWDGLRIFRDKDAYQVCITNPQTEKRDFKFFKVNSANIRGLLPGTTYVFKVRLVKGNGEESEYSENSDEVTTKEEPKTEANIPGTPYAERVFSDSVDPDWLFGKESENSARFALRTLRQKNRPGKPIVQEIYTDSVDIKWDRVEEFHKGDHYQVRVETVPEGSSDFQNFEISNAKIKGLKPKRSYIFKVRWVKANGDESPYSEESDTVTTLMPFAAQLVRYSKPVTTGSGELDIYELPLNELLDARNEITHSKKYEIADTNQDDDDLEICEDMQVASIPKQIRNILNEYPADAQILKELIQNADDAEASELKILYEGRDLNIPQPGDKLLKKFYQAPALCIYNDAKFTEKDWKGIKLIGDSVKENDPFKVGKFGLGFKSVFHLTDYPMIISDDRVLCINPLANNDVRTIKLINLGRVNNLDINDFLKSMQRTFGFTKNAISEGKFNGTIFWFPLRKQPSELSSNVYTENNVLELLQAFMSESHQMLLFLKYLRRIRLYVNMNNLSSTNPDMQSYNLGRAQEFYTVEITNDEYIQSRLRFTESLQKRNEAQLRKTDKTELNKEDLWFCDEVLIKVKKLDEHREYTYQVTQFLKGTNHVSEGLAKLLDDKVLSSIPFVGIAAPLCKNSKEEVQHRGGHIFCFQPLPQDDENHVNGLPVHVNAQFALSQNRRHVKWASEYQDSHFDRFIEWNRTMIKEVLPEAYHELIKELVRRSISRNNTESDINAVYRSIPFGTDNKWQPLTDRLLSKLLKEDVLFTEIDDGKWIKSDVAVVAPEKNQNDDAIHTVYMLLKSDNVSIVHLPEHVRDGFKYISKKITELSPEYLCKHMKTNHSYYDMNKFQKEDLLLYLYEGGDDLLNGLNILYLSNDTYTEFIDDTENSSQVFVEPHLTVSLLPGLESRFASTKQCKRATGIMESLAKKEKYQLRQLSWASLVQCLVDSVKFHFGSCTQIRSAQLQDHIWSTQIEKLWELIGRNFTENINSSKTMHTFQCLPLFPLIEEDGDSGIQYLNALNDIYLVREKTNGLTGKVLEAFLDLGVHVIDNIPSFVNDVIKSSEETRKIFHTCSGESIDSLLTRLRGASIQDFNDKISTEPNCKEHPLVHFLSSRLKTGESLKSREVIRRLSVWQQFKSPSNPDETLVCLEQTNVICTDRTFPVSFSEPMIITRKSHFAKCVGGREMSVVEICVSRLNHIETLSDEDLHIFCGWLIDKEWFLHNEDIKKLAKETKVVKRMLDHVGYLSSMYSPSKKIKYLGSVTKIYTWLKENSDLQFVKSYVDKLYETKQIGCVWTGDGFDAAGTVVVDLSQKTRSYAPFLNRVATEHAELTSFFIAIGCIEHVTPDIYVKTLSRIKDESEKANNKVTKEDMRSMSIDILNTLQREYNSEQLTGIGPIYVPIATEDDASFRMKEAKECTYCDAGWHEDDEDDIVYVHSDVPLKTAQAVGVLSLAQQFLTECEGFEEWGQSEPLTRRLNKLLKDNYLDGFTVAKELFQNAEDAGASCLRILYDERENENFRENLLSPGMEEMQGPALWIYNDACFSDEDFGNITKLNGATKEKDSSKIGKFGLGFCSVYNLTDVPSILSRSQMVIFDPNIKFLQQALPGKKSPGMMIDFKRAKNQKMIAKCKNQFQPFQNIWDCDIVNTATPNYPGTLLRLPLRIRPSDVSDIIYTRNKVHKLLKTIEKVAADMFIFTQNIKKLEVLHLPKSADPASGCKPLFEVTSNRVMYTLDSSLGTIEPLPEFKNKRDLQPASVEAIDKLVIDTKTWVKTNSPVIKNAIWLVSWCTASDKEKISAAYPDVGKLSLGAVAAPLNEEGSVLNMSDLPDGFSKHGIVFCFLPLPIKHNLPFHFNGPFEVTSDRRFLHGYSNDDLENPMKEWNALLLKDPVTSALVFLLEHMKIFCCSGGYNFFSLWPVKDNDRLNGTIVETFYRKLIMGKYKILKGNETWLYFSQCLFLDPELQEKDANVHELALKVILNTEKKKTIVDIPPKYYTEMLKVEAEIVFNVTVSVKDFLLKYFLPTIEKCKNFLDRVNINSILVFAIKLEDNDVDQWLKDNDSIPTKPGGKLICPKLLIHPDSTLSCLFSEDENRAPDDAFVSLRSDLERLGMRMKYLDDSDVVERAKTISMLNKSCSECASDRQRKLLKYLKEHIEQCAIKEINDIDFIPVLQKPPKWPFHWKLDSENSDIQERIDKKCNHVQNAVTVFRPPGDLYVKNRKDLVGCVGLVASSDYGRLTEELKFKNYVQTETILQQLETLAETHTPSPENIGENIIAGIYQELETRCGSGESIKTLLGKRVVFAGNEFIKPEFIALNCTTLKTVNCVPYLYSIHLSPLQSFQKLCSCLEIKDSFSSRFIAEVIGNIRRSQCDKPLDDDTLAKVIALLKCLSDCIRKESRPLEDTLKIYVPDKNKILREARDLVFDNKFDRLKSEEKDFIFAHPDISAAMAHSLGIISRLRKHITNSSEDIEDFYQEEPLVRRIHNLLKGYPCDTAIFRELMQNSDDAGATEIHFVNDTTRHSTNRLLEGSSPLLQGPALCVFNNTGFSAADMKGITQLGKGNKGEDPFATGQYGVGFNAVYNLTDVPSFMTTVDDKEVLCVFDPLAKHVPDVSNVRPGKRYNNLDLLRTEAPDMVKTYHEGELRKDGKGTIFRFPFRQVKSDISNVMMTPESISELFQQLQEELPKMIIFLKSLERVRLSEYTETGFKELCCVDRQLSKQMSTKRKRFLDQYKKFCKNVKSDKRRLFDSVQIIEDYTFTIDKDSKPLMNVQVVQAAGFKEPGKLPKIITEGVHKQRIGMFPVGGVALCTTAEKNKDLVHQSKSRAFCFLPLPEETGLSAHVNGHFALNHETRRGLWKPEDKTEDKCERFQWNMAIINQVIVPSFASLIQLVRKTIFPDKLPELADVDDFEARLHQYEHLLPCEEEVTDTYWKSLSKSLYKELVETNANFAPYLEIKLEEESQCIRKTVNKFKWIPLKRKRENDKSLLAFHKPPKSDSCDIVPILSSIGMQMFNFSEKIGKALKWAEYDFKEVNPRSVIDFLKTYTSSEEGCCNIQVDVPITESSLQTKTNLIDITEFCLKDKTYLVLNMSQLPIVMTEDERLVNMNKTNKLYITKYVLDLFGSCPVLYNRFLHHSLYPQYSKIPLSNNLSDTFKILDIEDFVKICLENNLFNTVCRGIRRLWDKKTPTAEWIKHVFDFVIDHGKSDKKDIVKCNVMLLQELSVIPVKHNESHYLYPASDTPFILSSELKGNDLLKRVLTKCKIPTLDKSVFLEKQDERTTYQHLYSLLPDFSRPKAMFCCLNKHIELIRCAALDVADGKTMLAYAAGNIPQFKENVEETKEILKKMPIFLKVDGTLTHIYTQNVVVCEEEMGNDPLPYKGLQHLKDTLFLQGNHNDNTLYSFLGFTPKSVVDIYVNVIFKNHTKMERSEFYSHVNFVLRNCSEWKRGDEVRRCLQSLDFIGGNKRFRKIGQVFNPAHKIFMEFCEEDELLPKELRNEDRLNDFMNLGLQNEMTFKLLKRFAEQLSTAGNVMSKEVREKSKLLCGVLIDLVSLETDGMTVYDWQSLSTSKFLIAERVKGRLSEICPGIGEGELTSFNESVPFSQCELCWTSCSLLPKCIDKLLQNYGETKETEKQNRKFIVEKLGIKCKPTLSNFIKHCKNIGERLSRNYPSQNHSLISSLLESIYVAFKEYMVDSSDQFPDCTMLENIPLVLFPDKNILIPAVKVVIDCTETDEIENYLYRAPIYFGKFHDVFAKLGASEKRHAGIYARVLSDLARDVQAIEMLPNERHLSIKATKGLIHCLKSVSETTKLHDLFLPSNKHTLESAKSIVVCDNLTLMRRLGDRMPANLKYLIESEVLEEKQETIVECVKMVSADSAPHLLSSLVKETVKSEDIAYQNNREAQRIMTFIQSPMFMEGVQRIVKHQFKGTDTEWDRQADKVKNIIQNIELRHVSGLKTVLQIRNLENGTSTEYECTDGTEEEVQVHLFIEGRMTIVLFQDIEDSWYSHVKDILANHIADNLQKDLTLGRDGFSLLCSILDKEYLDKPQSISTFLDRRKIKMYTMPPEANPEFLPTPGMYVPRKYHQYLNNTYGVINEEDFQLVAYELDVDFMETDDDDDAFEKYVFARIISKQESQPQNVLFQMYEVDIGEATPRLIPGHRLYTFKRTTGTETDVFGTEVEVFEPKSDQPLPQPSSKSSANDIKAAFKEVRDALRTAWTKIESEKKHVVKRLLLKWHPDKNHGNEDFCTHVFKYIQQCIMRLEKGETLTSDTEDYSSKHYRRGSTSRASSDFTSWFKRSNYGDFAKNWQRYGHGSRNRTSWGTSWRTFFNQTAYEPWPCPAAAKIWMRQAEEDLRQARIDGSGANWVCYTCHQAAEKALTAAWYAKDGNKISMKKYNHSLTSLAIGLSANISVHCERLELIAADTRSMRYPDEVGNRTAGEKFMHRDPKRSISLAEKLISEVKETYNIRV